MKPAVQSLGKAGVVPSNAWKPYPAYKDSGVPWLGRVPSHWKLPRLGAVLMERFETNEARQVTQVLSVLKDVGVIPYDQKGNIGNKKSDDIGRYKIVRPDDIVVNCMNVIIGSVGLSRYTGCLSPVYYVLIRRSETDNPRYLNAVFQNRPFQQSLVRIGNGILAHRMRIPMELLKCEPFPLPPPADQDAVVRFLDHQDRLIRTYIRAKQKLIALLTEQKQAIIQRAVTRGLNPDVKLKASGVDWLGEIPEHWQVLKIKRIARIDPSRAEAVEHRDSSAHVVFLPMERISVDGHVDQSEHRSIRDVWQGFTYFRRGDVVVAKITPCFENGKGATLSGLQSDFGFGTTELIVLQPLPQVSSGFLYLLTMLAEFRRRGVESMTGAAGQQRVSPSFVGNFVVPVPPTQEQAAMVSFVTSETTMIQSAITRATRQIALMREYRTRLIADVVTGKVDVRAAQVEDEDGALNEEDEPAEGRKIPQKPRERHGKGQK